MRSLQKKCVAVLLSLLTTSAGAAIRLYTEEAATLAFTEENQLRGMSVEISGELISRTGSHDAVKKIRPWARGYYKALHEPNTAIFSTVRTPEREKLFQWVGPILVGTTSFYSLKSRHLTFNSLLDAKASGPLAVPKKWYTYDALSELGFENLYGVSTPKNMVTMLKHGRVKLIATQDVTLKDELATGGLKVAEVQSHVPFMQSAYYIAFSLKTDPKIVATWQRAFDDMRHDGSFSAILKHWLPDADPRQSAPPVQP
ncbi:substrate-binding periplasmic protein [Pseudomonas sp. S9]|uniref:substrate-binding periplasmic protein n=1 Tax=Pseudomonas sp. S9 TaxID=686578 RepID=UPI00025575CD|nr:transporter substrate-binding domain-containing protein [Pseudomonas sp. S9]